MFGEEVHASFPDKDDYTKDMFMGTVVEVTPSYVTVQFDDEGIPAEEDQAVPRIIPVEYVYSRLPSSVDPQLETWEQPTTVQGLGKRTESPGCK